MTVATKVCGKCKQDKPLLEFSKDCRAKTGLQLQSHCKVCNAKYYQSLAGKKSNRKASAKTGSTIRGHLQKVFSAMKRRCEDPNNPGYKWYGARGIKVRFKSSDEFIDYVVNELQTDPRGLTIDRIDNDGNYERNNIRFVTHRENQQNKRKPCHV